jgi:hypothetical protein
MAGADSCTFLIHIGAGHSVARLHSLSVQLKRFADHDLAV